MGRTVKKKEQLSGGGTSRGGLVDLKERNPTKEEAPMTGQNFTTNPRKVVQRKNCKRRPQFWRKSWKGVTYTPIKLKEEDDLTGEGNRGEPKGYRAHTLIEGGKKKEDHLTESFFEEKIKNYKKSGGASSKKNEEGCLSSWRV